MSYANVVEVDITTDASGNASVNSPCLTGHISAIRYVKPNSGGFTNGSTFTITNAVTGETIWTQTGVNASTTVAPRQATHSTAGVAALFAAGGASVNDRIAIANHPINVAISGGGNAAKGTFFIVVD